MVFLRRMHLELPLPLAKQRPFQRALEAYTEMLRQRIYRNLVLLCLMQQYLVRLPPVVAVIAEQQL